jgi:hypothetical protein
MKYWQPIADNRTPLTELHGSSKDTRKTDHRQLIEYIGRQEPQDTHTQYTRKNTSGKQTEMAEKPNEQNR